ncbi:MAG: multidrug transporter MatE [Gemmatimonadetes bacterium]|nr:multidrug transporter MatE [Gemmatimonadota bacterium]
MSLVIDSTEPAQVTPEGEHARRPRWALVRDAIRGTRADLTSVALGDAIILLAVPMVLEMCMESIFAVADVFWVGHLGADAVATVGLTESMMIVIYTLAMGLAMGAMATVARRIGEKDPDGAARTTVQAIALGLIGAAVMGTLGAIFAPRLLQMMGASPSVLASGTTFARIMLGGCVSVFLLFLVNSCFRGAGDAAVSMRALWLSNAINIGLGPLLIFGVGPFPRMGVTGAAVATTFGRSVGVLYVLWKLSVGSGHLAVARRHLEIMPALMWKVVKLSGSVTLQFTIGSASWILLVRIVSTFGSAALAGYTIAIRIVLFALLPSWGLANAAATLVGQSLGAKQPERAERAVWTAARFNLYFLGSIGVLFVVFAGRLASVFTIDPEAAHIATVGLRTMAVGFPFNAYGMVFTQSFNGAGDTRTPTWLNLGVFWFLQTPMAWLLATSAGMGPGGAFLAVAIANGTLAVVAGMIFRRGKWKLARV